MVNDVHTLSTGVIPTLWTPPVDNYVERLWITRGQPVENDRGTLGHSQGPRDCPRTPHIPCGPESRSEQG
jgi:hypothetical protein